MKNTEPEIRFFRGIRSVDESGCWIFGGVANNSGYCCFNANGLKTGAHRYSYMIHVGPIPEGLVVRHSCDNRRCVNPDHLSVGTYKDNMGDAVARGRTCTGERHGMAKLSESQVLAIQADPRQHAEIAADYGICRPQVTRIKNGKTWRKLVA